MKASDVMTSPVKTIGPRDTIQSAIETMLGSHLSGMPVVDGAGKLIGIISEGDFLRRAEIGTEKRHSKWMEFLIGPGRSASDYVRTHGSYVEEIMTTDPISVEADTPLADVVDLLERHKIKRVPVVRNDMVIGIVTRADLLASLLATEKATNAAPGDDATIRSAILAELAKKDWVLPTSIRIEVAGGIVTLGGTILDERERDAVRVAAENVPGVKAVHDQLVWIDPNSGAYIEAPPNE
jgi:CBS domain-containing protein